MQNLVRYRERALQLRRLADFGTEGELRSEMRQLAAELATWVVNLEIRRMTEGAPPKTRMWRPWRRRRTPALGPIAPA